MLGFLSVSTIPLGLDSEAVSPFQSRAGFSECLDVPVWTPVRQRSPVFQSRAGFSECLDMNTKPRKTAENQFQSRAGFSECLDLIGRDFCPRVADFVSIPCWVF